MNDDRTRRLNSIRYDFFDTDRIWPPGLPRKDFNAALTDVLLRLPDDIYDEASSRVSFVVWDPRIAAVNIPFQRLYPNCRGDIEVRFDTIVVFSDCKSLSHDALVGLLAHEIAHSFVSSDSYYEDEERTDNLATTWGFGEELAAYVREASQVPDSDAN